MRDGGRVLATEASRRLLWRTGIVGLLLMTFVVQTRHQWEVIQEGTHAFLIGDWLISYAGGFVRRGFFGTILGLVAPTAQDGLIVLFAVQTTFYSIIFGVVIIWALRLPEPRRWAPLLLSPAFLVFGLNAFQGTHRKEIIVIAGLLLLAEAVRSGRFVLTALGAASILLLVGVLSHEANALLAIPFLLLMRSAADEGLISERAARRGLVALGLGTGLFLVGSVLAPGTVGEQQAVCEDLVTRGFDAEVCRGSIAYLGESLSSQVATVAATFPTSLLYAVAGFLAFAPFALSPWARANRASLFLAVAPLAPLFVVALDWGRWIMLAAVITTTLTVVASSRAGESPHPIPLPFLMAFVIGWSLPHYAISLIDLGQSEVLRTIVDFLRDAMAVVRG